jgi:hypothetical protein
MKLIYNPHTNLPHFNLDIIIYIKMAHKLTKSYCIYFTIQKLSRKTQQGNLAIFVV